jgi:CxxC-x17-CxxC domain-containing protein
MTLTAQTPGHSTRTDVVCTKCSKPTSVPFTPTPGRPVFCRDCFSKTSASRGPPRSFGDAPMTPRAPVPGARKRMMAQGRKTHFLYDAKASLVSIEGGMDDKDMRAFLEGLFARGARGSTEDAQIFLEQKVNDGVVKHEQAILLGKLIDKYSFFR